jgi:hypothetical protein
MVATMRRRTVWCGSPARTPSTRTPTYVLAGTTTVLVHNDDESDNQACPRPKHIADHTRFDSRATSVPARTDVLRRPPAPRPRVLAIEDS